MTLFSKTFKKPKHQSDGMCQLPRKKPKLKRISKKAKQIFDAKRLYKKSNLLNLASKTPIWQPWSNNC